MKIKYWFEMPNKWTFKQPKLLRFISKYIPKNAKVLVPFAGKFRFGTIDNSEFIYNDINPKINADYHVNAIELKSIFEKESFDAILADPPFTRHFSNTLYGNEEFINIYEFRRTAYYLLKTKWDLYRIRL